MNHKKILRAFLVIIIHIILINSLTSCGLLGGITANRYFKELNAGYSYNSDTQVLKKFASEIEIDEKNEFLTFDGKKEKPLTYETVSVSLEDSDKTIEVTYTIHNDTLIIAEVPVIVNTPYEYLMINGSTDKFIITLSDNSGAYLVSLNNLSATSLLLPQGTLLKTMLISPDGKYLSSLMDMPQSEKPNNPLRLLYIFDIDSNRIAHIMEFENKEFLCWVKDSSGDFLYREKITGFDGIERYSNIYKCPVSSQESPSAYVDWESAGGPSFISATFLEIDKKYAHYEMMADGEHIYALSYKFSHLNGILYIKNIYTQEEKSVVLPRYAIIWDMSLSETKEYAALLALYVDINLNQVTRLVTVNLETNDIRFYYELGYEPGLEDYDMHSFYWCPNNVLMVNFLNTRDLYKDICRFHRVNHTKSNIPAGDLEDIIYQDSMSYEEEE